MSVSIGSLGKEPSTALGLANWNSGHNTEVCLRKREMFNSLPMEHSVTVSSLLVEIIAGLLIVLSE